MKPASPIASITHSPTLPPLRVAATYLGFGLSWVILTDFALVRLGMQDTPSFWTAIGKGSLFVVLSAGIVYAVVWREVNVVTKSMALLDSVIEGISDAVFVKDRNGVYLHCNRAAAHAVGKSVAGMIGQTDENIFAPESIRRIWEVNQRVLSSGENHTEEQTLTAAGVTRDYLTTIAPYRDSEGNILGIIGIARDITEHKAMVEQLRMQELLIREAGEMANVGGWSFDPVTRQVHWTEEAARIHDADYEKFGFEESINLYVESSQQQVRPAVQAAISHGVPFDLELELHSLKGTYKWVRAIGRPVVENGKVIVVRGSIQDISSRKQLENELRDNETRIRSLGDNLPEGAIYRYQRWPDGRNRFLYFSSGMERMFGLPLTEVATNASTMYDMMSPEDALRMQELEAESMANRTVFDFEFRVNSRVGSPRWIICRGTPTRQADGSTIFDGFLFDVTARRESEDRLRQLSIAVEQSPTSIVITDVNGTIEYVNPAFTQITGYSSSEAIGQNPRIMKSGVTPPALYREMWATLTSGKVFRCELRNRKKDGSLFWEYASIAPVRNTAGITTHYIAVKEDIPDRKAIETAVRTNEERLRAILNNLFAPVGLLDTEGTLLWVNDAPLISGGLQRSDVIGKKFWNAGWWEADEVGTNAVREAVKLAAAGTSSRFDVSSRRADGLRRAIDFQIGPIRDESGEIRFLIPTAIDITERQQAETALRQSEILYRGLIESIPLIVWVYDAVGHPFLHNQRWYDYTGQTLEQMLSNEWHMAIHPDDTETAQAAWKHSKTTGEPYEIEYRLRRADGVYRWFLSQGTPQRMDGAIKQWVGICIDIDDRKRAEQALQVRNDLYAMLSRTNRAVSRCRSAEELFREVCTIAVEIGRFRTAWVGVPDGKQVQLVVQAGNDGGYLNGIVISLDAKDPRSQGPTGQAAITGQPFVVNDFLASEITAPWHAQTQRVGFAASAAFPLKERDKVVAVLTVYAGTAGFFTDDLVETLREITPSVSFALDALVQERDRKLAEESLRFSEERFRAFMDNSPTAAWITDVDSRIEYFSTGYLRMFRLPHGDLIGKTPYDLFPHDIAKVHIANIQHVAQTRELLATTEHFVRLDGDTGEYLVQKFPLPRANGQLSIGAIAVDVTDLRHAEDRLRVLGTAIDSSPNAVFIADRKGIIRWANPAFSQLSGYSLDEAVGKNPRLLSSGRQDAEFYRQFWEVITSGRVWTGEVVERHKSGSEYTVHQTITPLTGPDGRVAQFVAVQEDVTARKRSEARLRDLAVSDPLTGLLNRSGFRERLTGGLRGGMGALLFLDLDRFKLVNDAYGHHVGDDLLRQVADRIRHRVRGSDITARLGGDEFAIVQTRVKDTDDAATLAQGLIEVICRPFTIGSEAIQIGVSIGIAMFPTDGTDADELLKKSDLAMYRAKQDGRGTFRLFTPDLEERVQARVSLESEIRRALERREFVLHYQPQLTLSDQRIVGVEALIRWNHPTRGLVPPSEFLPVAEDSGLILPMSDWVLQTACEQARTWLDRGCRLRMAVNVSVEQVKRGGLVETVRATLKDTALPASQLEIEITEGLLLPDVPEAGTVLNDLHAMGVKLAIDDFGTGYSSLSYLRRLPVDRLKVDRSFVTGLPSEKKDGTLVRAIVGLGHDLGLKMIAEGVETNGQLEFLRGTGCDEVQGYMFGRPVPAAMYAINGNGNISQM